jgi:hypothetical protein
MEILKMYGDAEVTVSVVILRLDPVGDGSGSTGGFDT